MARPRTHRCWALGLWALFLIPALAGAPGEPLHGWPERAPASTVTDLSTAPDTALLPARAAAKAPAVAQGATSRFLALLAALAVVLGLAAVRNRWDAAAPRDHRPLLARRYAIALRAPPLQLA